MQSITFLEKILAHKRSELQVRRSAVSERDLEQRIDKNSRPISLKNALTASESLTIIAEIKKASPSMGLIREDFQPEQIAQQYAEAGADAISILTDEKFFQGDLEFIRKIRPLVDLPLLRKDFIIDSYQLLEARAFGADAVLLIVAALEPTQMLDLLEETHALGMEALVEIHDENELETALNAGAQIVGVNNRDLHSFKVDLAVSETVIPQIPSQCVAIAESGVRGADDLARLKAAGAHAVLVGTQFMQQKHPGQALLAFKASAQNAS